jgi:hypothetical protein
VAVKHYANFTSSFFGVLLCEVYLYGRGVAKNNPCAPLPARLYARNALAKRDAQALAKPPKTRLT